MYVVRKKKKKNTYFQQVAFFTRLESANFDNFQSAVWNKLVVRSLFVVRILINISNFATWPGDVFTMITRIIYRHASRVKILVQCIFSPIMSTTVKESLYLDLDSSYYRILRDTT